MAQDISETSEFIIPVKVQREAAKITRQLSSSTNNDDMVSKKKASNALKPSKRRFINLNMKELNRYIEANIQFESMQRAAGIHENNMPNSMANSERKQLRESNLNEIKDRFKINPVNISRKREKLHSKSHSRIQKKLQTSQKVL